MDLGDLFLLFIEQYHEVLREADEAEMKATGLPDITIHQFFYLQEIRQKKVTTLTELANALNVTKPSANGVVSRLIKEGFLSRTRSEEDQRKYFLSLTDKGRLVFHHKELAYKKFIRLVESCTTEEQQKLLAESFQIMISVCGKPEKSI